MAISPFRPDARGLTAAVPQMASGYNDLIKAGSPYAAPKVHDVTGLQAPSPGMPYGAPLDARTLAGASQTSSPFRPSLSYGQKTLVDAPMVRGTSGVSASQPSPWRDYGGAFGGVNQNDLYRKRTAPAAGPNGLMGAAPNLDFNAMAKSQVGGQGAATYARKPWEGVFNDAWRTSTDEDFRILAARDKLKNPDGSRMGSSLFGRPPSGPSEDWREPFNADTGVSLGYGPARTVTGERDPASKYASMSDEDLDDLVRGAALGIVSLDDESVRAAKYEQDQRKKDK